MVKSVSVRIGGEAGDGIASSGEILAKAFSRSGLHVTTYNGYQSVIRGGHVFFDVRAAQKKIYSPKERFDILVALNEKTINIHGRNASYVLHDDKKTSFPNECPSECLSMPFGEMARKYSKNPILRNTVALGACIRFFGMEFSTLENVLRDIFGDKGEAVLGENLQAARDAFLFAEKNFPCLRCEFDMAGKKKMLITGNHALAFGAVSAGCRFYTAYPMTPASSILHWFASHSERCSVLVKQVEDEVAAINMVIGASFAGVRAMCGTSGGGFALMTEAAGLAGMIETPVVVVVSQRAGPSTGLATKTEQGDLNMMLGAGQSDFPRIIIAPRSVEDCFYSALTAFDLAEKYQTPVFLALDLYLSEHHETVDGFEFAEPKKEELAYEAQDFKRYRITETGVSRRSIPGQEGLMFVAGSDEHDEDGTLISDVLSGLPDSLLVRKKMMDKRMRKLEYIAQEIEPPLLSGDEGADLTLLCWGSAFGACEEARWELEERGFGVNVLAFKYLFPLHPQTREMLSRRKRILDVEQNHSAQFANLLRSQTGINIEEKFLKYNGEPLYSHEIVAKAEEAMK